MKQFLIMLLFIFLSCGGSSTITKPKEKPALKKQVTEGIVMKKLPNSIKDYTYNRSIRTFFHKSISDRRKGTVTSTLKKGKRISEDGNKYSKQAKLIDSSKIDPLWFQYFKEEIRGKLQVNLRVSSKGFPDIIIIETGIRGDIDLIACQYISKYRFSPAVGRRSGKKVSSWTRIANQY